MKTIKKIVGSTAFMSIPVWARMAIEGLEHRIYLLERKVAVVYAASEAVKLLRDGETTMAAVCLEDALAELDGKDGEQ